MDLAESYIVESMEGLEMLKAAPYGQIHLWVLEAIHGTGERHSASFWALLIAIGARRHETLRFSRLRQEGQWIRVSSGLFPKGATIDARTKRAAIDLLERAQVVEVRRFNHAAPHIRFKRKPRSNKT